MSAGPDIRVSASSVFAMHLLTSQASLLFVCVSVYVFQYMYVYMSTSIRIYECMRILLNATVYCIYEQRNVALLDAFECIACTYM